MENTKLHIVLSFILVCSASIAGCTSIGEALNPYKSNFECPITDKGKCISVAKAYNDSLEEQTTGSNIKTGSTISGQAGETTYQNSVYKTLAAMLSEPVTPVVAPPKIMRVLLLPYTSTDNNLFMLRYAYFFADKPKWVIGQGLSPVTLKDED
jgi:conjugal transfer pilus assembly protein TraV